MDIDDDDDGHNNLRHPCVIRSLAGENLARLRPSIVGIPD